jgi:hypothetical protein
MPVWDTYPDDYRAKETRFLLAAAGAGECAAVIGLSGAGKSNLMGFLAHRLSTPGLPLALVDGNRVRPPGCDGLFALAAQVLDDEGGAAVPIPALARLERSVARRLGEPGAKLCLLFDRYDALPPADRAAASGPLRALRDRYKYQLSYIFATRRPVDPADELAELLYANTLWLGALASADARWSAAQYAARRGLSWGEDVLNRLVDLSRGYPALLRAACEAYAAGAPLEPEALRAHPAVQRRVEEFWADQPSAEDLRRSGLTGHPLLAAAGPALSAGSPDLTASEHRLLAYLQRHTGAVCEKDDLIRAVWPEERVVDGLRDDSLAQLVRRLRQKIGAERIQTVPGRGYRYPG